MQCSIHSWLFNPQSGLFLFDPCVRSALLRRRHTFLGIKIIISLSLSLSLSLSIYLSIYLSLSLAMTANRTNIQHKFIVCGVFFLDPRHRHCISTTPPTQENRPRQRCNIFSLSP